MSTETSKELTAKTLCSDSTRRMILSFRRSVKVGAMTVKNLRSSYNSAAKAKVDSSKYASAPRGGLHDRKLIPHISKEDKESLWAQTVCDVHKEKNLRVRHSHCV